MEEPNIFEFHASVPSCLGSQLPNPKVNDLMLLQVNDWYSLGLALKLYSYDLDRSPRRCKKTDMQDV